MKKYFRYELKRNSIAILFFTLLSTMIYVIQIMSGKFIGYSINGTYPISLLSLFCTIVPVMVFSFKMNRRCVDEFYSMPIRREKLYLVHSLVGLIMVFFPYTVAFWSGFLAIAITQTYNMLWFVLMYFVSLPVGVLLFGINSFAFTRANRIFDGLVFMGFFVILFFLPAVYFTLILHDINLSFIAWTSYSPLIFTSMIFELLIRGGSLVSITGGMWAGVAVISALGIACWFGLFYALRLEKAENAGQVSTSWFGYKFFLPFTLCFLTAIVPLNAYLISYYFGMAVLALVGNIIYRRTFRLPLKDVIALIGALVAGLVLSGILKAVF